jgi:prepilin-type processing-associated H-X9-DG protein
LVELLVVISIIGLLAGLAIPAIQGGLAAARKAESVSQLRQLGTLAVAYTAENAGSLPEEGGEGLQGFSQLRNFPNAWYNVLPPMAGFLAASNYLQRPAGFYEKGSLFFLKGAKYPVNKASRAYFAYGINSQLEDPTSPANTILNMNRIRRPSKTALFAEARLPDETSLPPSGGRSDDLGQPKVRDRRFVARHGRQGIVVFCDGHAESIPADKATDTNTVIWEQL